MARDYKKEYKDYHGTADQRTKRASRNRARAALIKAGRVRKGDGKEVDHKNLNPNDNSAKNLRVIPKSMNRKRQPAHKGRNKK